MNIENISGFLSVDKPAGISSAMVVAVIKRKLKLKKVGHAGTLDPLATGVLPLAIGEATKAIDYIVNENKVYTFEITFGSATNTDDLEGEIIETSNYIPSEAQILEVLKDFTGDIMQIPPIFSSIKVSGKRAYDIARAGEEISLKERMVKVFSIKMLSYNDGKAKFIAETGKGVYIRSIGRDMAKKLNSCGHISYLRRNSVGNFKENSSLIFENVYNVASAEILKYIISLKTALCDVFSVDVNENEAKDIRLGKKILIESLTNKDIDGVKFYTGNVCMWNREELVAVARSEEGKVLIKRVFGVQN